MSSFDSFFTDAPANADDNFISKTFETFATDTVYTNEITKVELSDSSKKGWYQLAVSVDSIGESGAKEPMGKIWVSIPEVMPDSDAELASLADPLSPEGKEFRKQRAMYGRFLFDFLKSAVPETFYKVKLDKVGKKTVAVAVENGAELAKEDQEAIEAKLSSAVGAFAKAAVQSGAGDMLVGKRFRFRKEVNKKNPKYTNDKFLLPDEA